MLAEDIRSQQVRHVNSCFFSMVAVDDQGRPSPVPPLQPGDERERRRFAEAALRKQLRRELEERYAGIRGER